MPIQMRAGVRMHTILVIDDEAPVRKLLKVLLEKHDFRVITAENGLKGIAAFKAEHVDLVVTDIVMPDMEGIETIGIIKKYSPDTGIIAFTGGGTLPPETYLRIAGDIGASRVFAKPLDLNLLLDSIKELLQLS